mgnify:CR=1 FL=1
MKNIEVKKIVQAIETSDGAGVKLKRSIGTPEADYICLLYTSDAADD